ncbi:MAG: hypothetical protein CMJ18_09015 [Phycisphaeraceae bacterium]|nr:hypothetical protein [Phycisphaeraceae bacterium]
MARATVVFNEDGDLTSALEPGRATQMLRDCMVHMTDQIPIDIYEAHSATPDICFHPTKVGETLGARMLDEIQAYIKEVPYAEAAAGGKPYRVHYYIANAIEMLRQEGTSPIDVRAEALHQRGVKFIVEMRMGDTHQSALTPDNPLVSQFAMDHPEYVIKRPDGITPVALDYSHEQVRAHRLAILREIAEEHDVDGLSLNFMRWGKYFERDRGFEKAPIMTDFVGQIRAMLDAAAQRRGRGRLLLGARVMSTIEESFGAGLDVGAWMQRGWLDYVIPCEHNCSWPGLEVEQFVSAAEGTDCAVYGMMGDMIGGAWMSKPDPEPRGLARAEQWNGYCSMLNTSDEARATAANVYAWGATGIGFWNIPNNFNLFRHGKWGRSPEQQQRMLDWIHEAIDPDRIAAGTRRYHYVPIYKRDYHGVQRNYKYLECWRSQHGAFKGPTIFFNEGRRGARQVFPFRAADGREGETLEGTLRFRMLHCLDEDAFGVDINGTTVPAHDLERTEDRTDPEIPWTWVKLELANCPPLRGDNELGLTWRSTRDTGMNVPYMEELDMIVHPG